jgi:hypothetical protein
MPITLRPSLSCTIRRLSNSSTIDIPGRGTSSIEGGKRTGLFIATLHGSGAAENLIYEIIDQDSYVQGLNGLLILKITVFAIIININSS